MSLCAMVLEIVELDAGESLSDQRGVRFIYPDGRGPRRLAEGVP